MIIEMAVSSAAHMGETSLWMTTSMIVLSLFLLSFAWALLRRTKPSSTQPEDTAAQQFARGEIDAERFEQIVRELRTQRRSGQA